eukprot:scaffold168512_cov16-Prasinocladus_malaysianus.AAC.1
MVQDMFYMSNPGAYFARPCEEALVDTNNFGLLKMHLMYAAHESPLTRLIFFVLGALSRRRPIIRAPVCGGVGGFACHWPLPAVLGHAKLPPAGGAARNLGDPRQHVDGHIFGTACL